VLSVASPLRCSHPAALCACRARPTFAAPTSDDLGSTYKHATRSYRCCSYSCNCVYRTSMGDASPSLAIICHFFSGISATNFYSAESISATFAFSHASHFKHATHSLLNLLFSLALSCCRPSIALVTMPSNHCFSWRSETDFLNCALDQRFPIVRIHCLPILQTQAPRRPATSALPGLL
jgi:hypothetical protein